MPASASTTVVVNVVSDVACPWCWVGKRAIEVAARNVQARGVPCQLELHWHPFQLMPQLQHGQPQSAVEHLTRLGFGRETVAQWLARPEVMPMNERCAAWQLPDIQFRLFANSVTFSTYLAHMLLTYAGPVRGDYAAQTALKEALLRKTHAEGKNMDDVAELTAAAMEAGVAQSSDDVQRILRDDTVRSKLDAELQASRRMPHFNGVPHFTFPTGRHIGGADSVAHFEQALMECVQQQQQQQQQQQR